MQIRNNSVIQNMVFWLKTIIQLTRNIKNFKVWISKNGLGPNSVVNDMLKLLKEVFRIELIICVG